MPICRWLKVVAVLIGAAWWLTCASARAQPAAPQYQTHYKVVQALLTQPDNRLDLADIKLAIDALIDPGTDVAALSAQLEAMAMEVRSLFPPGAPNLVRFKVLRDYLFRPPTGSGRKPFLYNFDDDRNPRAKLMSVYLATRRGNCISMPLLFVILAQKLHIPVTTATAPAHLYLMFRADNGRWFGVEATNGGGWTDEAWLRQTFPSMTQRAIDIGLYLQPLTLRETAAVMAESLLEQYEAQGTIAADEARIQLGALILQHYPMSVPAMGHSYEAYRALRRRAFEEKYARLIDIPQRLVPQFLMLEHGIQHWGWTLRDLGYRSKTPEMEAAYRRRIDQARQAELHHRLLKGDSK